mgnify:CR=1 FL=1
MLIHKEKLVIPSQIPLACHSYKSYDPCKGPDTEFNIIKSQHEKTMLDMNKMIQSIIGSMQYSKELIEDNYSYR